MHPIAPSFFAGCAVCALTAFSFAAHADAVGYLASPNGAVRCTFATTDAGAPKLAIQRDGKHVADVCVGFRAGAFDVAGCTSTSVVQTVKPVWGTAAAYPERYNEITLALKSRADGRTRDRVTVRVYDEGVAFKSSFVTDLYTSHTFDAEPTALAMASGTVCWGISKTEGTFPAAPMAIAELDPKKNWHLPLTMKTPDGLYASFFEANVRHYPRSYLRAAGGTLTPRFVMGVKEGRGRLETPWRVLSVAPSAARLVEQGYLVELLNDPCAIDDASWIKPGLCFSDSGNCELVQTQLIAAARAAKGVGARYFQIDWGWHGTEVPWSDDDRAAFRNGKYAAIAAAHPGWEKNTTANPRTVAKGLVPYHPYWHYGCGREHVDFDVAALVAELKKNDMGLCLYVHGHVLENENLDDLFALYEKWGLAGLKPGFVAYGSERTVEWMRTLAATAAKHHLWLDVHDLHVPDGFERTWPNLMISEGGGGEEGNHPVRQDVALPFTRCLAGPFDYTPRFFNEKRTHAHAAAMLLVYPGPTAIMRGKVKTAAADAVAPFMCALPWNYDETRVLAAEVADHIVVARRKDKTWYLAGLTGETPRTVKIDGAFLGKGKWTMTLWTDDQAAKGKSKPAEKTERKISAGEKMEVAMSEGGGFVAIVKK